MLLALDFATDAAREVVLVWPEDGGGPRAVPRGAPGDFLPEPRAGRGRRGRRAARARRRGADRGREGRRRRARHRLRLRAAGSAGSRPSRRRSSPRRSRRCGRTGEARARRGQRPVRYSGPIGQNSAIYVAGAVTTQRPSHDRPRSSLRQQQLRRHLPRGVRGHGRGQRRARAGLRRRPLDRGGGRPPARDLRDRLRGLLRFNGTAANSLALAALCQSYHSILCHETAHVETDECGAPEFFSNGTRCSPSPVRTGSSSRPPSTSWSSGAPTSTTRSRGWSRSRSPTELGTLYQLDEVRASGSGRGPTACGCTWTAPASATRWRARLRAEGDHLAGRRRRALLRRDQGGMAVGEAIVFFDRAAGGDFDYRCKQAGQLASKMRFLAAPWVGMLRDGAWLAPRPALERDGGAARARAARRRGRPGGPPGGGELGLRGLPARRRRRAPRQGLALLRLHRLGRSPAHVRLGRHAGGRGHCSRRTWPRRRGGLPPRSRQGARGPASGRSPRRAAPLEHAERR